MPVPTETLAVISTAHVTKEEAEALTKGGAEQMGGMQREYGWMLSTRTPPTAGDFLNLAFVLGYLRGKGFDWVLFDCDAEDCDELEQHEW